VIEQEDDKTADRGEEKPPRGEPLAEELRYADRQLKPAFVRENHGRRGYMTRG
jgi:hypothetical protein